MTKPARLTLFGALLLGSATAVSAADFYDPPVVEAPPPPVVYEEVDSGGWYIRGDIGYHWSSFKDADYVTYSPPGYGSFDFGDLRGAWSFGAGVGYQANKYFRTDLTLDYWAKSEFTGQTSGICGGLPCQSVDETSYSALVLLANAYAEFGSWKGITPYVGAGIGGARIKWDDLRNTVGGVTTVHEGTDEWRFAWALMAGASYCLTDNVLLDAGYRFTRVNGGRMFEYAPIAGPGFDEGIDVHEVRGGLRYQFGGSSRCAPPPQVYEPIPVEPPVYK
ncbi:MULTISPECIES: outer membrane protein [Nitratireductor]|uniref:outer membrane protein n=1 Tax=Nitratireductor TaxID=245876 RepID=UPI000D0CCFBE|nr:MULTISPECIES: outer membrane protein [Nitratireductor]PSM19036.1 porin family protein [Nitratireductor sp. StC3]